MGTKETLRKTLGIAPVLIWGPPGVGKSAMVTALGKELGLPVEVVLASIREPSYFSGLPVVTEEGVRFEPPAWAKRLAKAGKGILFLDDIFAAPPAVQAALLRVVLDRVVGEIELPPSVHIVAAAIPPELVAGGWDLSPPLANQFVHLEYKVNVDEWVRDFPTYWGNPPDIDLEPEVWARARAMVAGFIKARPHLLLQVPREDRARGLAWPSPRSWDHASRALAAFSLDLEAALPFVQGAVGEGAGYEFYTWAREMDLPDPEEVLQNPSGFRVPERGDLLFALLSSVVAAVTSRPTEARWEAAWEALARAAAQAPDIVAATASPLVDLARTQKFGLPQHPPEAMRILGPILKAAENKRRA